jgi:hypothetical protein
MNITEQKYGTRNVKSALIAHLRIIAMGKLRALACGPSHDMLLQRQSFTTGAPTMKGHLNPCSHNTILTSRKPETPLPGAAGGLLERCVPDW